MGQKVNPIGIRLGITRDWTSRWYAGKRQFPVHVNTDFRVREFLKRRLAEASVSRILIERAAKKVNITIQTARPGIVIGKKGEDIEKLRHGRKGGEFQGGVVRKERAGAAGGQGGARRRPEHAARRRRGTGHAARRRRGATGRVAAAARSSPTGPDLMA